MLYSGKSPAPFLQQLVLSGCALLRRVGTPAMLAPGRIQHKPSPFPLALSSSESLALKRSMSKGIMGPGPRNPSRWARDSEEESLREWQWLMLYPGEVSTFSTATHAQHLLAQ